MGKGSGQRPVQNRERFEAEWDRIFGAKKDNEDVPSIEVIEDMEDVAQSNAEVFVRNDA